MTGRAPFPLRLVLLWWLAALASLCAPAAADPTFPKFTGLVVDSANVIPDDREAALTQKLEAFQAKTNRQLVVATIPDLQGDDIEDYGYKLLRAWGVGLKDANNGAILIVAPNDRRVRIEVGYGLEPVLTDALSSVIVNTDITPRFKAGDVPGGIGAGVDAIVRQLSLPDPEAKAKQDAAVAAWNKDHARHRSGNGGWGAVVFWLLIMGVIFLSMRRGARRHGPWGARSYGGSNWPIVLWGLGQALSSGGRGRDDDWGGGGGWGGGGSDGGGGGWGGGGFTGGGGGSGGGGGASGELVMRFGPLENEKVAHAVAAAELKTDAEIVTIAAPSSDAYRDVAVTWSALAALLVPALFAAVPAIPRGIYGHLFDPWRTGEPPVGAVCLIVLIGAAILFLLARLLLADRRVLLALTPGAAKAKRVRRRALMLYKVGAQSRTRANTAVLLYLSAAERRCEIVTDDAITARIAPERWGEAMHAFVEEVRAGRAAEGMVAAVDRIGDTLAAELPPRAADDTNELPDRLITL